jgi:hypothetical protein
MPTNSSNKAMPMIPVIFTQAGVLWVDPWSRIRLAYKSIGCRTWTCRMITDTLSGILSTNSMFGMSGNGQSARSDRE